VRRPPTAAVVVVGGGTTHVCDPRMSSAVERETRETLTKPKIRI